MDSAEKAARIEELRLDSQTWLQTLARDGAANFNLAPVRLELLVERLLPDGSDARLDFELAWEEKANTILRDLAEQVSRAKLLQGVSGVPTPRMNGSS